MNMKFGPDTMKGVREMLANRHEPESLRSLADLYWRGLLSIAFCIITLVIFYGVWDLLNVLNALSASLDTSAPPPPALDRAALNKVIQGFETRQVQFDALRKNPSAGISDPSR
ncbi:hypothetical protein A3H16_00205 [Candidatus Kaiserbacteria bacterium RIFCSPLOWO2_12_FULL_53_8]|nr:MAG: hypothetical protein A3H16_00205 [Candidatus Kaiserbacteria bacterium RIFCSPLOWO2_12_FULL_53_8]